MAKTTSWHMIQAHGIRLALAVIMAIGSCYGITASAADASDVPAISRYYPGKADDNPQELKPTAKAYIYFATGAKIVSARVNIVQEGKSIGTCTYLGKETGTTTVTMDPNSSDNTDLANLQPGNFTFEVYEVTYLNDGEPCTYSDIDNPIGSVTYRRAEANGCVVASTGFEDRTIKSYYPADATEGIKTYTFDRPVIPDKIFAEFQYGQGDVYLLTKIPHSLSEDGLTLTIDLRGKCYNQDVLAPGVTFVDDYGNPCDPPSRISLIVSGLNCVDGTKIATTTVSYDGMFSQQLEGQIFEIYDYADLTFSTPRLSRAEFFDSAAPATRYNNINADTDMMELMISDKDAIQSAGIRFASGTLVETIPYSDITDGPSSYTVSLPAGVRSTSTADLTISLIDVVYVMDDGLEHIINSLSTSSVAPDITTVADLKNKEPGSKLVFNAVEGIKITMANEAGYIFAEDSTGAIQISLDSNSLEQGTLIQGRLSGQYAGYGLFIVDLAASDYTVTEIDVTAGLAIDNLDMLSDEANYNKLVTIKATDGISITYNNDYGMIMVNDMLPVIIDFAEGIDVTKPISSVTGILYHSYDAGQSYIILRSAKDTTAVTTITDDIDASSAVYDMRGIRVRGNDGTKLPNGVYIVNGKKTLVK